MPEGANPVAYEMRFASLASITVLGLFVVPRSPTAAPRGTFAVSYRDLFFRGPVSMLTVMPGETVSLTTFDSLGAEQTLWAAPTKAGLYPIRLVSHDQRDSMTVEAFVLVPYSRMRGEYLRGYHIGRYPSHPLRGSAIYRPPVGFIEVTRANENTWVSPHFQLKQFVCKQVGSYPKYVVLNELLLQKLEYLLSRVQTAGYHVTTFTIMSGYRTPAYNRALGNVPYSRHEWGSAADIFIDEDHDGRMDDLNGDGRSDYRDAELLYTLFEAAGVEGGMGKYRPTEGHGPFVHVDVRDRRARW